MNIPPFISIIRIIRSRPERAFPVLAGIVFLLFAAYLGTPPGRSRNAVIDIQEGMSSREIARMLRKEGVIRSAIHFRIVARAKGYAPKFRAGRYRLPRAMRTAGIARFLAETAPNPMESLITIPEGANIREIASILGRKAHVDSAEFVALAMNPAVAESLGIDNRTLEGYLYPETYFIADRAHPMPVIRRMTGQFRTVFSDSLKTRARKLGMTVNEVVTLASLIETEAVTDGERPLISSVFHRRLRHGIPLQANPTVQYVIGEKRRLYKNDMEIDSPYNTYRYRGLPPGPIASPGIKSIRAALYPADTKYLYFVADGTGKHVFSASLEAHNAAVARYLRQRNHETP